MRNINSNSSSNKERRARAVAARPLHAQSPPLVPAPVPCRLSDKVARPQRPILSRMEPRARAASPPLLHPPRLLLLHQQLAESRVLQTIRRCQRLCLPPQTDNPDAPTRPRRRLPRLHLLHLQARPPRRASPRLHHPSRRNRLSNSSSSRQPNPVRLFRRMPLPCNSLWVAVPVVPTFSHRKRKGSRPALLLLLLLLGSKDLKVLSRPVVLGPRVLLLLLLPLPLPPLLPLLLAAGSPSQLAPFRRPRLSTPLWATCTSSRRGDQAPMFPLPPPPLTLPLTPLHLALVLVLACPMAPLLLSLVRRRRLTAELA